MIHVGDFPVMTSRRLTRNFPVTRVKGKFQESRRNELQNSEINTMSIWQ